MVSIYEEAAEHKRLIEQSAEIINTLIRYVNSDIYDNPLEHLGTGTSHIHYRLGKLESGLWLATRESITFECGDLQKNIAENYASSLNRTKENGINTLKLCLGVKAHHPTDRNDDRYFLIVEDLTNGRKADFIPAKSEREGGLVDGKEVHYDFLEQIYEPSSFRLMTDDLMIHLKLEK